MKLDNGKVIFASYSTYNILIKWLKKKNKRVVPGLPHELIKDGPGVSIALKVEDIPKNPPRPKVCNKFSDNDSCALGSGIFEMIWKCLTRY